MPVIIFSFGKAWCLTLSKSISSKLAFSLRRFLMFGNFLAGVTLLALISFPALADSGKVESLGACTDAAATDSIKKALAEKGHRILLPDGSVVCEIWLRKALSTHTKTDV